jgi:hypothetical protein
MLTERRLAAGAHFGAPFSRTWVRPRCMGDCLEKTMDTPPFCHYCTHTRWWKSIPGAIDP